MLVVAICAALIALTFAGFRGVLSNGFVNYDDGIYVGKNPHVQDGLTMKSVAWAFTSTYGSNWHPLTWLSHMLDVRLFGLEPGAHHLISLVLHASNAMLLFLLLVSMTAAIWRSAFVAALFAIHPLHVESVAWIAERKDVLSTLFWLLTLAAWLRYLEARTAARELGIPRENARLAARYLLVLALYACGLMSKPMLVTLPFTLLILDYWPLRRVTFSQRASRPHRPLSSLPRRTVPHQGERSAKEEVSLTPRSLPPGPSPSLPLPRSASPQLDPTSTPRQGPASPARASPGSPAGASSASPAEASSGSPARASPGSPAGASSASPAGASSGSPARLVLEKAPLFAMSAASCVATYLAQRRGGAVQSLEHVPFGERVANALLAYASYLGKTFWPAPLAVFYPHTHIGLLSWSVAGAALLLGCGTALALRLARRAPYFAVGWLWYLGTLVPVIGLVQVGEQATADRYTYVPLLGVFIAIAWGLGEVAASVGARVAAVAAAATLLPLLALTRAQVGYWADSTALFEHALAVTSDNWMAHNNLGGVLSSEGRAEEAIAHFEEVLRIRPDYADADYNLGIALEKLGRHAEAIEHYERALRLRPNYAEAHYNLGNTMFHAGRIDDAIQHYKEALRLRPDDAEAENNLGIALARQGRTAEAIEHYEQALRTSPDSVMVHNNLGIALVREGRIEDAIEHYSRAVNLRRDYAEAWNNLGFALAKLDRWSEAADRYRQALRIRPKFAEAHNNLGIALAQMNQIPDAIAQFEEAVRLEPDFTDARDNLERIEAALRSRR